MQAETCPLPCGAGEGWGGGTSVELLEFKFGGNLKVTPTLALPRQREREQIAAICKMSCTQRQPEKLF